MKAAAEIPKATKAITIDRVYRLLSYHINTNRCEHNINMAMVRVMPVNQDPLAGSDNSECFMDCFVLFVDAGIRTSPDIIIAGPCFIQGFQYLMNISPPRIEYSTFIFHKSNLQKI